MKLKIFLIALLLTVGFCIASVAFAQTMTDTQKQALIYQIQQQIAQLQTQLTQMLAQQQGNASWCYTFNNNLGFANSGANDVVNLHLALQQQGIFYSPDSINTFSTGTSQAVIQFQAKYGISPQTGFVGPKTRDKLNQLYKCSTTVTTCSPSWQCSDWALCIGGQQNKTCTDSNNCGVDTNKPKVSQACTQKSDVKIQADNSDGPVNVFLTLGNGASVSNSGITLTKNINLQWNGVDVSSCMVSDSLTPTIFSGYKPSSGSQTVSLSGNIQGASGSNNKVSGTFRITCISAKSGSSVSDNVTVNLFYTVSENCDPRWQCLSWTSCANSQHTRVCTDWNGCGSLVGKPIEKESCSPLPTVNIKANNSDGPLTISNGSSVSLSWTSLNATSCHAIFDWSGTKAKSGTESISDITSSKRFDIVCTGAGGEATDSVTINLSGSN